MFFYIITKHNEARVTFFLRNILATEHEQQKQTNNSASAINSENCCNKLYTNRNIMQMTTNYPENSKKTFSANWQSANDFHKLYTKWERWYLVQMNEVQLKTIYKVFTIYHNPTGFSHPGSPFMCHFVIPCCYATDWSSSCGPQDRATSHRTNFQMVRFLQSTQHRHPFAAVSADFGLSNEKLPSSSSTLSTLASDSGKHCAPLEGTLLPFGTPHSSADSSSMSWLWDMGTDSDDRHISLCKI